MTKSELKRICTQDPVEMAQKTEILVDAAKAVVNRWDTPLWKDAPATAEYINKLRNTLDYFK